MTVPGLIDVAALLREQARIARIRTRTPGISDYSDPGTPAQAYARGWADAMDMTAFHLDRLAAEMAHAGLPGVATDGDQRQQEPPAREATIDGPDPWRPPPAEPYRAAQLAAGDVGAAVRAAEAAVARIDAELADEAEHERADQLARWHADDQTREVEAAEAGDAVRGEW